MRAEGSSGELRVGFQHAADISRWELEGEPGALALRAKLDSVDAFWITQGPFAVSLCIGDASWTWRQMQMVVNGSEIRATITERPEVRRRLLEVDRL